MLCKIRKGQGLMQSSKNVLLCLKSLQSAVKKRSSRETHAEMSLNLGHYLVWDVNVCKRLWCFNAAPCKSKEENCAHSCGTPRHSQLSQLPGSRTWPERVQ